MNFRQDWKETQLGEVLTFQRGFDFLKKDLENGDYDVIFSSGVGGSHNQYKVKSPGVIIGRKGTLGKVYFSKKNFWPTDTTLWVKDFHGNDEKFAYYFLQTLNLEQYDCGSSNPTLNRNHIHPLTVKYPPLPTQQKIASILSAYDELIENNTRQIKILEEMAQLIYREWFVKFKFPGHENVPMVESELGLIPEGWEVAKVENIVKRLKSGIKYKEKDVLKSGQIPVIDQSKNEFLGFHNNEPDHIASAKNPIILFGDHTCKMQLMVENFSLAENVIPFISKYGDIPIDYLYFLVKSLVETKEYKRHWTDLMSKTVIVAKFKQTQKFSEITKLLFKQINIYQKENIKLKKTSDLLLPKLISGEIDVEGLNIKIGGEAA